MNATSSACSLITFAITRRTVRISDWGRERRTVEHAPELQVASCLRSDSAGCIIVTLGLPHPATELLNWTVELRRLPVEWAHSSAANPEEQHIRAGSVVRFVGPSPNVRDAIHRILGANEILARDRPTQCAVLVDVGRSSATPSRLSACPTLYLLMKKV
jgi:hypothetical protein